MYKGHTVAVVVPAYNEERHIGKVLENMPDFVDLIIVVDDASTDATSQRVQEIRDDRVVLLVNERNLGVGGSVIRGYRKALERGCDIVVKMDGDGQMPASHLESLLSPLVGAGYDYAKGNRFLLREALQRMPRIRRFGNMVTTFLTKLASGYWHIFDPQNGFTAASAQCLRALDLDQLHRRFFFENDMLVQLNIHGFRVKDVPMPAVYGDETSHLRISLILITFPALFFRRFLHRIYQKYVLRDFSPIALFLGTGALLSLWGIGFGLAIWIKSVLTGVQTSTGTVMLAVLPLVMGFQLLLQAVILDIQETPR